MNKINQLFTPRTLAILAFTLAVATLRVMRALEEMNHLTSLPGWDDLQAVKNQAVHLIDFDWFTQPAARTRVDGIDLLASVLHPAGCQTPDHLNNKPIHFSRLQV